MSHRQNVMFDTPDQVIETTYQAKKHGFKGLSDLVRHLVIKWLRNPYPKPTDVKEPEQG